MAHSKSLAEMFPDIASQWDYNRDCRKKNKTL